MILICLIKYLLLIIALIIIYLFIGCRYKSGDRLSPDHEKIIVERLLPFHPKYEKKIGSGIDHILVCSSKLLKI